MVAAQRFGYTSRPMTREVDRHMPSSADIRRQFIDYFVEKHEHKFVPSSPVMPHADPTLLFANAGMNQFKPYFLGTEKPDATRVANTQKCIRAGGKHNDLDDVGKDTYHHTFFEMLGNWSFGDYFKAEAIEWAWDLLVNVWGLDPARLHATYFEGDAAEGLEPDDEAKKLWAKYLPDERIHPGNKKDNFWEMGDTGPCGPCSEVHYDGTADLTGGDKVNADDSQVIEIWNLVFIQFNRQQDGKLVSLPSKHVDTGMGFERITRILQGKDSNYDTDVFMPLFDAIADVTGARKYSGKLDDAVDTAYRVIADHIRTLTFALSDGAHCGNDGREYVLRRILRRAVRYGKQTLGVNEPFFHKLVPAVVKMMGEACPELNKNPDALADELREEEESFRRTLDRGIELFDKAAKSADGKTISGDDAFELMATYGFPLDLTQLMAQERGMAVDVERYEQCLAEHRRISQANGGGASAKAALVDVVQQSDLPATRFVGYDTAEAESEVVSMYRVVGAGVNEAEAGKPGDRLAVVTKQTPFYAEAGGQVGDIGTIAAGDAVLTVRDTQRVAEVIFHFGEIGDGSIKVGDEVKLAVDARRRDLIRKNHTATHIMNRALRKHVNREADQRGSLVDNEKLRFDFTHGSALKAEEVEAVEKEVNDDIAADLPVYSDVASQEEALKINGLRAVFGEKYPPKVRVVSIGQPVEKLLDEPDNDAWAKLSIEFCGGTHLDKTGDAEGFAIVSQEAVAKGVRRVTALTGKAAHEATANAQQLLHRVETLKSAPQKDLETKTEQLHRAIGEHTLPLVLRQRIEAGVAELAAKVKEQQKAAGKEAESEVVDTARAIAEQAEGDVIVSAVEGADGKTLRAAMDVIRKKQPDAALLLGAVDGEKCAFVAAVPKAMVDKGLKAGDWVREVAKVAGGGGGGRPDMAQAGGKDASKLDEALEAGRAFAASKIE